MYDPELVAPMRAELSTNGVEELRTPEAVDEAVRDTKGTLMIVVNSVCGCAAGGARPGVLLALKNKNVPSKSATVFAGQDREATDRARSYFHGYSPSSPSVALLKDGEIVFMLPRTEIEGYSPEQIALKLSAAFDEHCSQ